MTYAILAGGRIVLRALPRAAALRIRAQYPDGKVIIDPRSVAR